ncbi:MAG: hypothetical protein K6D02_09905, partial [Lachnospiraceae bacterium]|nr:hypothetical protein [Lachnospiraceae bacterium]
MLYNVKGVCRYLGIEVPEKLIGRKGKAKMKALYRSCGKTYMNKHCNVLGIEYAVSNMGEAIAYVKNGLLGSGNGEASVKKLRGSYITFSNVHTTVMAKENPDYCSVQNRAAIAFADGAPVAAYERKHGYPEAERVCGPDFMKEMFLATQDGSLKHY